MINPVFVRVIKPVITRLPDGRKIDMRRGELHELDGKHAQLLVNRGIVAYASKIATLQDKQMLPTDTQVALPHEVKLEISAADFGDTVVRPVDDDDVEPIIFPKPERITRKPRVKDR